MQVTMIIGHGTSPAGRGGGEFIDLADRVVRMWECAWQSPEDHGTKYTHGILETHQKVLERFYRNPSPRPSRGWIVSHLDEHGIRPRNHSLPDCSRVWDQRIWIEDPQLGQIVGGRGERSKWELTRGGFAGCWAIQTAAAGDLVVMVGCDNLERGRAQPLANAFPAEYLASPACAGVADYVGGAAKTGNHDFAAERRLLELLADMRQVVLQWGL